MKYGCVMMESVRWINAAGGRNEGTCITYWELFSRSSLRLGSFHVHRT